MITLLKETTNSYVTNGAPATQAATQARVEKLENHIAWLTHLCQVLAARLVLELAENADDDLVFAHHELTKLDPHT